MPIKNNIFSSIEDVLAAPPISPTTTIRSTRGRIFDTMADVLAAPPISPTSTISNPKTKVSGVAATVPTAKAAAPTSSTGTKADISNATGIARALAPAKESVPGEGLGLRMPGAPNEMGKASMNLPEPMLAAEQKKKTNVDALVVALGDIGASLMGPFQDSWQAQLGRSSAGLARSRIYASAMEKALAGEIPDDTGLALLSPEQQMMIGQTLDRSRAAAQEERRTVVAEEGPKVDRERIAAGREEHKDIMAMNEKELGENVRQFNETQTMQKAESEARIEQYKAYAKRALVDIGAPEAKSDDLLEQALNYVKAQGDAFTTLTPEEQDARIIKVMRAIATNDYSKLGAGSPQDTSSKPSWKNYQR